MTRTFLTVSHTGDTSGDWGLDDLAGSTGRIDVLCRNIQAALCWSHDLRPDTQAILVFADPERPTAIRIDGAQVRHLNPDERSTAARIRNALKARPEDPWWEDVEPGIKVAPFGLEETLEGLTGSIVVPHAEGRPFQATELPADPVFVMGDHQPLSDAELAACGAAPRISLGDRWLHGNAIIHLLHWRLDS